MLEKQWEYTRLKNPTDNWDDGFANLGLLGWELVSVAHERDFIVGYFKRVKKTFDP